jgi:hypothetical protein
VRRLSRNRPSLRAVNSNTLTSTPFQNVGMCPEQRTDVNLLCTLHLHDSQRAWKDVLELLNFQMHFLSFTLVHLFKIRNDDWPKPTNEVTWTSRGTVIFITHAPQFYVFFKHGRSIHQKQSVHKSIWIWKGRSEHFLMLHKKTCLFLYLWLNSSQCLRFHHITNSWTRGLFRNVNRSSNFSVQTREVP